MIGIAQMIGRKAISEEFEKWFREKYTISGDESTRFVIKSISEEVWNYQQSKLDAQAEELKSLREFLDEIQKTPSK